MLTLPTRLSWRPPTWRLWLLAHGDPVAPFALRDGLTVHWHLHYPWRCQPLGNRRTSPRAWPGARARPPFPSLPSLLSRSVLQPRRAVMKDPGHPPAPDPAYGAALPSRHLPSPASVSPRFPVSPTQARPCPHWCLCPPRVPCSPRLPLSEQPHQGREDPALWSAAVLMDPELTGL